MLKYKIRFTDFFQGINTDNTNDFINDILIKISNMSS